MTERTNRIKFSHDKKRVIHCLNTMKLLLDSCIADGMIDSNARFHNELIDFLAEAHIAQSDAELQEVITQARCLEMDFDAWLSHKGLVTLSLEWPNPSQS
jgi:hypothetical protein